jgi:hypothetical protein
VDALRLKGLIEKELGSVRDARVVGHIRWLLVEPCLALRDWDYGQPNQRFPCWTVLDDPAGSGGGIAYSEHGFGPRCPWGLFANAQASMGMDSGWFSSFLEAYFESRAATALPIWRVFSMDGGAPAEPLTGELSWAGAWTRCEHLRRSDPASHYMVHHTISFRA